MLERGKSDFPELPHYYTQIFSFQQKKKSQGIVRNDRSSSDRLYLKQCLECTQRTKGRHEKVKKMNHQYE